MADDYSQRPYRNGDQPARRTVGQGRGAGASSGNDPLAELARLIGQNDPFAEYGRRGGAGANVPASSAHAGSGPAYSSHGHSGSDHERYEAEAPIPSYLAARRGQEGDRGAYQDRGPFEDNPYDQGRGPYAPDDQDFYDDEPLRRRRPGFLVIAGIFALAVTGTAVAFGYKAIFGASSRSGPPPVITADATPKKIVPPGSGKDSSRAIDDRINERGAGEKILSREERPVDFRGQASNFPASQAPEASGNAAATAEPKKIRTVSIRPDGTVVASADPNDTIPQIKQTVPAIRVQAPPSESVASPPPSVREVQAPREVRVQAPVRSAPRAPAPNAGPLSLDPNAPAPRRATAPARTASLAPAPSIPNAGAGGTGNYAVQVTSQRSDAEAQAALRNLQGKFPAQLGGKQSFVHKVDLGTKGTYYRGMIGPFDNPGAASELCSSLKAAGGQCFVQRN
jgi:hypothetical protein